MKFFKYLAITLLLNLSISTSHAANLEWNSFDGDFLSLDDYRGKVVLVTYWASYCLPCHQNLKNLDKLYSRYKDRGFEVVTISLDKEEQVVTDQMLKLGIKFPVTLKSYVNGSASLQDVIGTPTNFLINRNGQVVKKLFGSVAFDTLEHEWIKPQI